MTQKESLAGNGQYMKEHKGVWFATGSEIAQWWLKQGFSKESIAERPRAVAQAAS